MRQKLRNPVIVTGLIVLILGLIVVAKSERWQKRTPTEAFFPLSFEKFCFNELCLYQENGKWFVSDGKTIVPGNRESIEGLVSKLKEIKLEEVVSNNPERFKDFGIDGSEKMILAIGDKKLEIGKITANYDGTYVREDGGKLVYKIPEYLETTSLGGFDYWQQKMLINLSASEIKKVRVKVGKIEKVFEPKDNKWVNEKWINKVALLVTEKFLDGFRPETSLTATIKIESEKENITLALGRKKNIYWVSADDKYFFQINRNDFNLLTVVPR